MTEPSTAVPVLLVGGFLGAGKTTFINYLLGEAGDEAIAVIVNEFGSLGIDGTLIRRSEDGVVQLTNGCICCEVNASLAQTVTDLLRKRQRWWRPLRFSRIVVELSGLASPGPVAQTFLIEPALRAQTVLTGLVTLAHAKKLESQLDTHPEAVHQLAMADRVLLNHCDRVGQAELAHSKEIVERQNPLAVVYSAEYGAVELSEFWNRREGAWPPDRNTDHVHSDVQCISLSTTETLDIHQLKMYIQFLMTRHKDRILRVKGVFRCAEIDRAVVAQGVYQWLQLGPGETERPKQSRFVVLGTDLYDEEIRRGWSLLTTMHAAVDPIEIGG